jgi:hypothetical protein
VQGFRGCEPEQTSTFERVKYRKFKHETQQTPAPGDTNSCNWWQVAGIWVLMMAALDQESPGSPPVACGSSPGEALRLAGQLTRVSEPADFVSCAIAVCQHMWQHARRTVATRLNHWNPNSNSRTVLRLNESVCAHEAFPIANGFTREIYSPMP